MVHMCPFVEAEFLKWRRMARSILPVPLAILALMCIIAYMMFVPVTNMNISQSETMLVQGYLEEELPQKVDPSAVVSGDVVVSVQDEDNSQEGYIAGEVVLTSNP